MATTCGIGKGVSEGDSDKNGDDKNDDPKFTEKQTEREGGGAADTFLENELKTHIMEISKLF